MFGWAGIYPATCTKCTKQTDRTADIPINCVLGFSILSKSWEGRPLPYLSVCWGLLSPQLQCKGTHYFDTSKFLDRNFCKLAKKYTKIGILS
jgi:hypothetical protein